MRAVNFNVDVSDGDRRRRLYDGELFVFGTSRTVSDFCAFARELIEEAFPGLDPEKAQFEMPVERYAAILTDLKPRFIHHLRSKQFVRAILAERGCDLDRTYFDVPRMRSSTSNDYLTSGIAYAWHPHRDTWYSAPAAQINWWLPIYTMEASNGMAFHTPYFDTAVANTSSTYNYYEWNAKYRRAASENLKQDTRPLPGPTAAIDSSHDIALVIPVGGVQLFSAAQLHSSVPNQSGKTRFSIDFRTVNIDDIAAGLGAANVDNASTGSSIRDFIRASDFAPMPEAIVRLFDDGSEQNATELLYQGNVQSASLARSAQTTSAAD